MGGTLSPVYQSDVSRILIPEVHIKGEGLTVPHRGRQWTEGPSKGQCFIGQALLDWIILHKDPTEAGCLICANPQLQNLNSDQIYSYI